MVKGIVFFIILGLHLCFANDIFKLSNRSEDVYRKVIKIFDIFNEGYNQFQNYDADTIKCEMLLYEKYIFRYNEVEQFYKNLNPEIIYSNEILYTQPTSVEMTVVLVMKFMALNYSILLIKEYNYLELEQNYYREDYLTIAVYLATYGTAVSTDAVVDNLFYIYYDLNTIHETLHLIQRHLLYYETFIYNHIIRNYGFKSISTEEFDIEQIRLNEQILESIFSRWIFETLSIEINSQSERFELTSTSQIIEIIQAPKTEEKSVNWLKTKISGYFFNNKVIFESNVAKVLRVITLQRAKLEHPTINEDVTNFDLNFGFNKNMNNFSFDVVQINAESKN